MLNSNRPCSARSRTRGVINKLDSVAERIVDVATPDSGYFIREANFAAR